MEYILHQFEFGFTCKYVHMYFAACVIMLPVFSSHKWSVAIWDVRMG
uniref:Uncharacterized protein n=1 Tax=Rhizophora mucronata TaxID=61149 RepID=A0A2P2N9W5_RHIMU